jgi:hypothetical protein
MTVSLSASAFAIGIIITCIGAILEAD